MLLFACNKVTYADDETNSVKWTRLWINHPEYVVIRNEMPSRMD